MNETSKCKDCEFNKHGWCNLYDVDLHDVDLPLYGECYNWLSNEKDNV